MDWFFSRPSSSCYRIFFCYSYVVDLFFPRCYALGFADYVLTWFKPMFQTLFQEAKF